MPNGILVVNFVNNEVISHEIILIKGLLNRTSLCCENQTNKRLKVSLNGQNHCCLLSQQNNLFKCLLILEKGPNCIRFSYCCFKKKLTLIYQEKILEKNVQAILLISRYERNLSVDDLFLKSASSQILLGLRLIQCFLGEKLTENGNERKTFYLRQKCIIFISNFNFYELFNHCNQNEQHVWNLVAKELLNNFPNYDANSKFVAFLCTNYKIVRKIEQIDFYKIAVGGGGLALFSFDYLFTWPIFFAEVYDKFRDTTLLRDRYTLGDYFSKSLGAVCHEICHTFDLGHSERGLMSNEFHTLSCFFTFLHFHEFFDGNFIDLHNKVLLQNQRNCYDCVHLENTDCTILNYHKWFNEKSKTSTIKYDKSNQSLFSESGIRVVEIRLSENGTVLKTWQFSTNILKFYFQVPLDSLHFVISSGNSPKSFLLFSENSNGTIIKTLL